METIFPIAKGQGLDAKEVNPSDDDNLVQPYAAIWVGTGGDLTVTMSAGSKVTFKNVPSGCFLPIMVNKIFATDTDCADIVAVY